MWLRRVCVLHSRYQLVWMTDAEVASNIVMTSVSSPFLFVVDPRTHEYYLPDDETSRQISAGAVVDFFDDISNGSRQVHCNHFSCNRNLLLSRYDSVLVNCLRIGYM